jgi:thioredoxin-related protein
MTEYYGITSVPTVVFLNPEGRIFARHEGYLDQAGILRTLRSLAAKK